jgi:hypothetical protein
MNTPPAPWQSNRCPVKRKFFFSIRAVTVIAGGTLLFFSSGWAKMAIVPHGQHAMSIRTEDRRSPAFARAFESRMRPYFENRIKGTAAVLQQTPAEVPGETDILLLISMWPSLSSGFKALYKAATQIPDTFDTYVSPGGRFDVYYIPVTRNSVYGVAVTDTLGYGAAGDWRPRISAPNGVPDYVDETAWALDSSWAMEMDRFGFIAPIPYHDSIHTSGRYPVVITSLGVNDFYGTTYPDSAPVGPKGYPSHIELRNNWNGAPWKNMGYEAHPENGIRVTCAHELFHGVQYAMSWNVVDQVNLDDFPLTWIEGAAVLMEELGFDYVNDYVQYCGLFFSDPGMSFFNFLPSYDMHIYSNVLPLKYLYEKKGGIGLIRDVLFNNYAAATPFYQNLRATSLSSGSPWTALLNRFHTASFYTGSRADTSLFFADAALTDQWSYRHETLSGTYAVSKAVNPYGMQIFSFAPADADRDTVRFSLKCAAAATDSVPYPSWAASCIIRKNTGSDTVLTLAIDASGGAAARIPGWKSLNDILFIVSNGAPTETRNATVDFMADSSSLPLVIFPNPGHLRKKKFICFEGFGIREIRIYTVDGLLVTRSADQSFQQYRNGFMWRLANSHGASVVPGCYTAVVTQRNVSNGTKDVERYKIMVCP